MLYNFMFWSGVTAWLVLAAIGAFFAIDEIVYRLIDSVKFKFWMVQYFRSRNDTTTSSSDRRSDELIPF